MCDNPCIFRHRAGSAQMENKTRSKCQSLASRREFVQGTLRIAALTTLAMPFRYAYASGATGDFAIDFTLTTRQ
jgi:hypothetical protein